jgi:hypothetical protein
MADGEDVTLTPLQKVGSDACVSAAALRQSGHAAWENDTCAGSTKVLIACTFVWSAA